MSCSKTDFAVSGKKTEKEGAMHVTVMIKREIATGKEKEFFHHLRRLRSNAIHQEGYISGETLIGAENTGHVVVVSKWHTLDSWYAWKNNGVREEIDRSLRRCQTNETLYEPYVFSKYKAAAEQGFPHPIEDARADGLSH